MYVFVLLVKSDFFNVHQMLAQNIGTGIDIIHVQLCSNECFQFNWIYGKKLGLLALYQRKKQERFVLETMAYLYPKDKVYEVFHALI